MDSSIRILNIGCGYKLEPGTDFVDFAPKDPKVVYCDIDSERLPYADGTFDKVYSLCLFEHLTNHANYMKEAYRVLKKGGKLEIITDNAGFIGFHIPFGVSYNHGYNSIYAMNDKHFALFVDSHLRNYAEKFGFENVKVQYDVLEDPRFIFSVLKGILYSILPKNMTATRICLSAVKGD